MSTQYDTLQVNEIKSRDNQLIISGNVKVEDITSLIESGLTTESYVKEAIKKYTEIFY